MEIVSFYSDHSEYTHGENNDGHSEVIPDMSLSVREILHRFRRGTVDVNQITNKQYYDDDIGIDEDTRIMIDDADDLSDIDLIHDKLTTIQSKMRYEHTESIRNSKESSSVDTDAS